MGRPTIRDLAEAAGVSIATVNRVLAGKAGVRPATMDRVKDAAAAIGFYGTPTIQSRVAASRRKVRIGFLLNQPSRTFYQTLGRALAEAAEAQTDVEVQTTIRFMEDLSPEHTARQMLALGDACDAIGVVAAVHPLIMQAIAALEGAGKSVFALISQLAASGQVPYVGLDNWKVGRTAGWAIHHLCREPGKVGILVGNHRYRCQEMNETGFRSYFREHAPDFTLLEPLSTYETRAVAQEMTEKLLRDHPDLAGLYVAGGGISGVIAGLRSTGAAGRVVVVGYELMDITREALIDRTVTFIIGHPLQRLAQETVDRMVRATVKPEVAGNPTCVLPFDIFTRENI